MNKEVFTIQAGAVFTPSRMFSPGRIIVEGSSIAEVGPAQSIRPPKGARNIDASHHWACPGFIDPHVHGAAGRDVMEASYDSLNAISAALARHGTTSFVATTVSSSPEVLTTTVERLGRLIGSSFEGARPLGIHLEGPFISSQKRGTHKSANIQTPNASGFRRWIDASKNSIRLMTVAPELDGIDSILTIAKETNVQIAMGHSNATFEQARYWADQGMCYAVHTFNAMREFHHRDPGITAAVLSDDRIFAEIIADGIHVDPSVVRIFARAKEPEHVLLATDAVSATGMADGRHVLGQDAVNVTGGVCRDSEGRLAGSTLTQEVALRNFIAWTGMPLQEALLGVTSNPAEALKLQNKGLLEPGADADIVILDRDYHVVQTFIAGKPVFESKYGQTKS